MTVLTDRILLHVSDTEREVVDPSRIWWVEAEGDDVWLRFRDRRRVRDVRKLGEVLTVLAAHGFVRVHKQHAVNARRVARVRRRAGSREWEVVLSAPVGVVLPVGRAYARELWRTYGER